MQKIIYFLYKIKIWLLSCYYSIRISKGTYKGLYRYKDVFGNDKYIKLRNRVFSSAKRQLAKKEHKTIRIVMVDCSEWCTTDIYNYFHEKGIDIAIVLAPFFHGTEESITKAYNLCKAFCEARNLQYIDAYDSSGWQFSVQNTSDILGDIMIYTNPWMGSYPEELKLYNLPLTSITCYIPYGFMLMKAEQHQFNQISHNMFTRIYCESEAHRQMYKIYCDIGNSHVEFSGAPKMDWYFKEKEIASDSVWNVLGHNSRILKIIYSPHWNIRGGHATFMDNGFQILEYAESHPNTTSWIYKPHPLLEKELIVNNLLSQEQYQAYVERWKNLQNARISLSGDYGDIFLSSDCMINDSISFIAEYMYTHKPMLLLQNDVTQFNSFGEQCVRNVYTCKGNDFNGILRFIENTLHNKDSMKINREQFFDKHLNYYLTNGKSASEYIISEISNFLNENEVTQCKH